jgi:hypothetical protein
MSDDFFDQIIGKEPPAAKRASTLQTTSPPPSSDRRRNKPKGKLRTESVSKDQVSAAKGRKLISGRIRKTIYLPPDLIDEIDAEAQGVGVSDFYHFLVASAWDLYQRGEIDLEYTEEVVKKVGIKIPGYTA